MAYITGTVTDANPGPTLYALMAPALTTAGYTLVDTVVIATKTHKIWKSAAANNSQGLDWYLDVAYTTTGAGNLWLTPFEFYDPATDLGYRGPYANIASTTFETTYYSRYGATGSALETNWVGAGQTAMSLTMSTSAFGYWMSITGNRVAGTTTSEATTLLYSGLFTPDALYAAKVGATIYPLVVTKMTATAGVGGALAATSTTAGSKSAALTRLPMLTVLASNGWGESLRLYAETPWLQMAVPATPTVSVAYPAAAVSVGMYPYFASGGNTGRFGTLTDVAIMGASAAVVRGDTVTINGTAWTLTTAAAAGALLFKAV